jgi:hypothetical protein
MKETIIKIYCDQCEKYIGEEFSDEVDASVRLENDDASPSGIWFGFKWFWFDNENFCCLDCMIAYVKQWHINALINHERRMQ